MRAVHEIIKAITAQGIRLGVDGEKLWAEGPADLLTPDLRTTLALNKSEILSALKADTTMTFIQAVEHFEQLGYLYELLERSSILEHDGVSRALAKQPRVATDRHDPEGQDDQTQREQRADRQVASGTPPSHTSLPGRRRAATARRSGAHPQRCPRRESGRRGGRRSDPRR